MTEPLTASGARADCSRETPVFLVPTGTTVQQRGRSGNTDRVSRDSYALVVRTPAAVSWNGEACPEAYPEPWGLEGLRTEVLKQPGNVLFSSCDVVLNIFFALKG